MFATQASTLKIQSKRNQIYTLKTSVDKLAKRSSETPVKFKTEYKLNKSLYEEKDHNYDKLT